ncbi:Prolyl 4-hydroxylase subunit alpha-1 [Hordeum vulgare]|nr:Prolyl 4-hydroxylase subunit alpha-1 [Hordeum vulgare]
MEAPAAAAPLPPRPPLRRPAPAALRRRRPAPAVAPPPLPRLPRPQRRPCRPVRSAAPPPTPLRPAAAPAALRSAAPSPPALRSAAAPAGPPQPRPPLRRRRPSLRSPGRPSAAAFLYSGFLSHAGKSVMSEVRASSGTFLSKSEGRISSCQKISLDQAYGTAQGDDSLETFSTSLIIFIFFDQFKDEIISAIEKRVAAWTFLPEENAESMQVLHYEVGQKLDRSMTLFLVKRGGHRVATVLMYLTDVKKGGETVFPVAEGRDLQHKDETWSECARHGLAGSL